MVLRAMKTLFLKRQSGGSRRISWPYGKQGRVPIGETGLQRGRTSAQRSALAIETRKA